MDELTQRILEAARSAGRAAASVCRRVLEEAPATPEAMAKLGKEPVTVADYGSQAVILREVRSAFPDHGVIAEEGAAHLREHAGEAASAQIVRVVGEVVGRQVSFAELCDGIDHQGQLASEFTWTVDPIDGTKGFLRREQFAIAIGVLRRGAPYAAVLACPNLPLAGLGAEGERGVLFAAALGAGSTREGLASGAPRPVRVSETADPARVRVLGSYESAHGDPVALTAVMADLGLGGGVVRVDSQVKYGVVASGDAEVYLRPQSRPDYRERIWDHAAGALVVEEAGGRVSDLFGKPLAFGLGRKLLANRGVLATNGRLHDAVLASLERLRSSGA